MVICIGQQCYIQTLPEQPTKLISLMELQRLLNTLEPENPIKVDGKVSPDWQESETQTKWDRIYSNQSNVSYFERRNKP